MTKPILLFSVLALFTFSSALARGEGEQPQTAEAQFDEAYLLLTQADQARDTQRFSLAIELYRQALDLYIELADTYPDWQPGVIRFRLSYCDNQLKALLNNVEDGRIKLRSPTADPETSPESDRPGPSSPASILRALERANALLVDGKTSEAKPLLLEALKAAPDNIAVRLLIGVAQCQARRFDDALFLLENLVEETPDNADAHVILGTAYFGLNRTDEAIAQMKKALELNPSHKEAHFNLAQILLSSKPPDVEQAGEHYRKARSLGITSDPEMDTILTE